MVDINDVDLSGVLGDKNDLSNIDLSGVLGDDLSGVDLSGILGGEDIEEQSEFSKGFDRGVNTLQAVTGDAIEVFGELVDSDKLADYGRSVSEKNRAEAAAIGPAQIGIYEQIQNAGDLGPFLSNQIGQAIPNLGTLLAGSTTANILARLVGVGGGPVGIAATTILGALAPSIFLSTGEAGSKQKELSEGPDLIDPLQALLTGVKAGSIDAVTVIPILRPYRKFFEKLPEQEGVSAVQQLLNVPKAEAGKILQIVKNLGTTVPTAIGLEAATGAAQESIFIKDAEKVTGKTVGTEQFKSDVINAAISEGIGGGVYGTVTSVSGPLLSFGTDSAARNFPEGSGQFIQFPNYSEFQKNYKGTDKSEITENIFKKVRDAEIQQYVDKPLRPYFKEIYAKGGKPYSSNYYGAGPARIMYDIDVKKKDGTIETEQRPFYPPTSRFYNMRKGVRALGKTALYSTIGKSVSALDDLAARSETAFKLRQIIAPYARPSISKETAQPASIDEAKYLRLGKYNTPLEQAMQKVAKLAKVPGTSRITKETNDALYLALNQEIINEATVPNIRIRQAANKIRDLLELVRKDAANLKIIEDIPDGKGGTFKGQSAKIDPGYIKGYFPILLKYQSIRDNGKVRADFKQMLMENGFTENGADRTVAEVIGGQGSTTGFQDFAETEVGVATKMGALERERKLKNIPPEALAPFVNTNVYDALSRYTQQAAERFSTAERFGGNNEVLQQMNNLIAAEAERSGFAVQPSESKRIVGLTDAIQKRYKPIESDFGRKLNSFLIGYGYLTTLGFATISSISEPLLVLARGGPAIKGVAKALVGGVRRTIRTVAPRFPKNDMELALDNISLAADQALAERLNDAFGGGQESNKFTEAFFRFNFLSQFTRFNRALAFYTGEGLMLNNARFLASNMKKRKVNNVDDLPDTGRFKTKKEQLRELGINPQDAVVFVNSNEFKTGNRKIYSDTPFYKNQLRLGAVRYINDVVMNPRATERPLWMSDPHLAIFSQLKGFQVTFSNTVLRRWYNEMFKSGFYNGLKNGSKFAAVGAMMIAVALFGNEIREFLQYGAKGNPRYKKEDDIEKIKRAVERTGLLGPFQFLIDSARAEKYGSGPIEALLGPIVSRLVSYMEGIRDIFTDGEKEKMIREIIKSIPGVSYLPQVKEYLYEKFDVPIKRR